MKARGVCLVVGAGDATGGAIAKRFAREGFVACLARRRKEGLAGLVKEIEILGGRAVPFGCDARDEEQVKNLFERIEREIGPVEVAVHNIGANVNFGIQETTTRVYRKVWEMAALSAFLMGREAAKLMVPRGRGTILFTGATASIRGNPGFAAFAGAKHAKRALAQAMARELGPKGIHVCHFVIDGPIDTAFIREIFGEEESSKMRNSESLLNPDHIADAYWLVHEQNKSAWTAEMDLRPYDQNF